MIITESFSPFHYFCKHFSHQMCVCVCECVEPIAPASVEKCNRAVANYADVVDLRPVKEIGYFTLRALAFPPPHPCNAKALKSVSVAHGRIAASMYYMETKLAGSKAYEISVCNCVACYYANTYTT